MNDKAIELINENIEKIDFHILFRKFKSKYNRNN
jgi:hypothetical protein